MQSPRPTPLLALVLGLGFVAGTTAACPPGDCSELFACGSYLGSGSGGGAHGGAGGGHGGGGGAGAAAPGGAVLWEGAFGDAAEDHATGIGILSDESLVVGGYFAGSLDFGGGALVSGGGTDAFVARLAPTGQPVWSRQYGGASAERSVSLAVDSMDSLILLGDFEASIDFGLGALTVADVPSLFAAKLTSLAQPIWSTRIDDAYGNGHGAEFVRCDPADDVLIAGTFGDGIRIGSVALTGPQQSEDAFVAKLSGVNHQTAWAHAATDGFGVTLVPPALAVDAVGNLAFFVYAGPQSGFSSNISYEGVTLSSAASLLALFRTDASGAVAWSVPFGGNLGGDVSTFANGDVLACGAYTGAGAFAPGFTLPTAEGRDVWVASYAPTGTLRWARRYGGPGDDGGTSFVFGPPHGLRAEVRCDALADGGFVLTAHTTDSFDFGGTVVAGSSPAIVMARLDAQGQALWTRRTSGNGKLVDVAVSPTAVFLAVDFDASTGLDASFATAGGNDIYLARVAL